jgi:hypothetical protein
MSIHAKFWQSRQGTRTNRVGLRTLRDSNRQRCYDWENKHLRPHMTTFKRDAAKGYARLCVKIAIRQMRVMFPQMTEADAEAVRASFKAAFTKERIGRCDASEIGAYFAGWGWTDAIIAHEVAHWADRWAHRLSGNPGFQVDFEGHGPKWRGWFAFLLSQAGMRRYSLEPEAILKLCTDTLTVERLAYKLPA